MQRLIRPVGSHWEGPAIEAWERQTGLRLPDDYRRFMLRYNGGRPFPSVFRHTWSEGDEMASAETYLEPLYDRGHLVTWNAELGNRLPPDTLTIGADPGLIEVLLSLRPHDHGMIYSWVRNRAISGGAMITSAGRRRRLANS